ncbi:hypothetical protein D3C73_1011430 [compost metagenome]
MADVIQQPPGVQRDNHCQREEQQAVDKLLQGAVAGKRRDAQSERNVGGARCGEQRAERQIAEGSQQQAGPAADWCGQQADAAADTRQRNHRDHRQDDGGDDKACGGQPQMFTGLQAHHWRENDIAGADKQGEGHKAQGDNVFGR